MTTTLDAVAIDNVIPIRLIVPDESQVPNIEQGDPETDPDGEQALSRVCAWLRQSGSNEAIDEFRRRVGSELSVSVPGIDSHDIVAIGCHPFSVINKTLVGHEMAEQARGHV